jgi:antirestriction protein ArdC
MLLIVTHPPAPVNTFPSPWLGETLENHVAYLGAWLKNMKDDPAYVFKASTQASRVADYLLAMVRKPEAVAG